MYNTAARATPDALPSHRPKFLRETSEVMKHERTHAPAPLCLRTLFAFALLAAGCASPSVQTGQSGVAVSESSFVQRSPEAPKKATVKSPLPPPTGHVNDYAKVIDAGTKRRLEEKLKELWERSRVSIAVAVVETTGGEKIFDYSLAVARGWGIGPPAGEEGGGVLLLIAVKDREWHIQVSRALEADLPNEVVGEIGGRMEPVLRKAEYGQAVVKCVEGLIERLDARRGR